MMDGGRLFIAQHELGVVATKPKFLQLQNQVGLYHGIQSGKENSQ